MSRRPATRKTKPAARKLAVTISAAAPVAVIKLNNVRELGVTGVLANCLTIGLAK
jgi:hypothetical protein